MLVSNTSTLVLLAKVGCLEAFIGVSPEIVLPAEVRAEVMFEKDSYYAKLIDKLLEEKKLKMVQADKLVVEKVMSEFRLGEGEAAAYALFDSRKHRAILTDDGELIKLCKLARVPFVCAMAAVIVLYERKVLTRAEALDKLEALVKVGRYSKRLHDFFRSEVG